MTEYERGVIAGVAEGVKTGREGALVDVREVAAGLPLDNDGRVDYAELVEAIDALRTERQGSNCERA
jgi:hypothetical protein